MLKKLFLFAALLFAFNGCQPKAKAPAENKKNQLASTNILRVNIGTEPRTLDPARASDLQSMTIVKMLFEGLTRVNQGKVETALAEKIDISDDLRTYTFHLRISFWSNGDRVKAQDFVYAWKRALDPKSPANAGSLFTIKNAKACKEGKTPLDELCVAAVDDKTLRVELENPTPYFLELVSYPVFFPINSRIDRERPRWMEGKEDYVGNGPFVLKEWRHHDQLTVKKNPKYWDAQTVQLQEIQLFMVKEEAELAMFENRQLDWAGSPLSILPVDALPKLREAHLLRSQPILGTYFLRLNTENKILASAKLRRALSLSIDREELVEHVLLGSQVAAQGYVPAALELRETPYFTKRSTEALVALFEEGLQEQGLSRENFDDLELLYASNERNERIAHALHQQWMHLFGISIKLHGIEQKVYFEKLGKGDFQMAAGSWLADFSDAFSFLEVFKDRQANTNHTKWSDPTYEELLATSNVTANPEQRKELLARCEQILLEAMPIIPIFHYNMLYVQNENVKNVYISRMGGIDFRWARFVQDESRGQIVEGAKK